jgi:hypothetical protein
MLLAGVDGCMLPRDGDDAIDEVDVEGDGGFVDVLGYIKPNQYLHHHIS